MSSHIVCIGERLLECLDHLKNPQWRLASYTIPDQTRTVFLLWILPRSTVHRDIALDPSFPVVMPDIPEIASCIHRDYRGVILNARNLDRFHGWFRELRIMDIGRGNSTGKWRTSLINQNAEFTPVYLLILIKTDGCPFFTEISLLSVMQCPRSTFWIVLAALSRSGEIS